MNLGGTFSLVVVGPFQRGGRWNVGFNRTFVFPWGHFSSSVFPPWDFSPCFSYAEGFYPQHLSLLCIGLSAETNSGLLLCLPTVQFLEGAGGNKPHYIAVCIGTSHLRRERPWLRSCLAGCRCEVLPSMSAQIPPVRTGALTQVTSCVKNFP